MQGEDLSLVEYSETRKLATNYLVPKTISLVLPCYQKQKIIKVLIA